MTYELAKQLQDARFPKETFSTIFHDKETVIEGYIWPSGGVVVSPPTLSELIEACGDRFDNLARCVYPSKDGMKWIAKAMGNIIVVGAKLKSDGAEVLGFTPEEAVARLWLELQK